MTKNKKIIIAVIFGITSFSLISVIIFQTLKDIQINSSDLISQKKELTLLESKIEDLREFEKEYKANKTELEKISNLFIDAENPLDLISFLNFLRKTAGDSGISITISSPAEKKDSELWPFLNFQVSANGKIKDTLRFLEKIENSPYLTEVSNISIMVLDKKKNSPDEISTSLLLRIYTR